MGWSESGRGCMRHPTTNRSTGVCSDCLRERLSQISDSSNRKTTTFGENSGYSFFSSNSSAGSASPARGRKHHRNASEVMGSIALFFSVGGGGGGGLKKSRSIAFVPRTCVDHNAFGEDKSGKKKSGFWSKLLGNSGKRNKDDKKFRTSFRV